MRTKQDVAMKQLVRARKFGSRRNKVAAKRAMTLDLPPVDALTLFRASISDYTRFGFGTDMGTRPINFF